MEILTSDEQIVERALTGDADAFGEIVRRWERRIFALAFGMLGREEDARDATQETFLAAFRNLRGFRGDARVSSWLHRIAVNQCITRQRRSKVRKEGALRMKRNAMPRILRPLGSYHPPGEGRASAPISFLQDVGGARIGSFGEGRRNRASLTAGSAKSQSSSIWRWCSIARAAAVESGKFMRPSGPADRAAVARRPWSAARRGRHD